jgi:formamidopyrimidine-DNA glycosylase
MSGSIRIVATEVPAEKHDHLDIILDNQRCLRYRDPRRFGLVLWTTTDPLQHALLKNLGPEPLSEQFDGEYLYRYSRGRRCAVKPFIMDAGVVVGVGNIYACEALFKAKIDPRRAAGRISRGRYRRLAEAIKSVLTQAIANGGTTLRDFTNGNGEPGYFRQQLRVYGQEGEPCSECSTPVSRIVQAQRSTWYCHHCQS